MSTTEKELCFIITPIGEDNAPIRRHIDGIIDAAIRPALSDKYEVQAAHHISKPGSITKQVIEAIYNAKLVIANLSERNPNVMYELALRHAIGKPVIMIVERGTPIPSDIVMQRHIPYSNDAKGVLELQADLRKAESEINFEAKGGPIFDVLGDITRDTNMLKQVAESNAESQEPLLYIMQRLDRIENSIHQPEVHKPYAKSHEFKFTYRDFDGADVENFDWSPIYLIENTYPWVSVQYIGQSSGAKNGGTILIHIDVENPSRPPREIAEWLTTCLMGMGFIGVKFVDRTRRK